MAKEKTIEVDGIEYSEKQIRKHLSLLFNERRAGTEPMAVWSSDISPYTCIQTGLIEQYQLILNLALKEASSYIPIEVNKCIEFKDLDEFEQSPRAAMIFAYDLNFDKVNEWIPWDRIVKNGLKPLSDESIQKLNRGENIVRLVETKELGGHHLAASITISKLAKNAEEFIHIAALDVYSALVGGVFSNVIKDSVVHPNSTLKGFSALDIFILYEVYNLPEGISRTLAVDELTKAIMQHYQDKE